MLNSSTLNDDNPILFIGERVSDSLMHIYGLAYLEESNISIGGFESDLSFKQLTFEQLKGELLASFLNAEISVRKESCEFKLLSVNHETDMSHIFEFNGEKTLNSCSYFVLSFPEDVCLGESLSIIPAVIIQNLQLGWGMPTEYPIISNSVLHKEISIEEAILTIAKTSFDEVCQGEYNSLLDSTVKLQTHHKPQYIFDAGVVSKEDLDTWDILVSIEIACNNEVREYKNYTITYIPATEETATESAKASSLKVDVGIIKFDDFITSNTSYILKLFEDYLNKVIYTPLGLGVTNITNLTNISTSTLSLSEEKIKEYKTYLEDVGYGDGVITLANKFGSITISTSITYYTGAAFINTNSTSNGNFRGFAESYFISLIEDLSYDPAEVLENVSTAGKSTHIYPCIKFTQVCNFDYYPNMSYTIYEYKIDNTLNLLG